MYLYKNIFLYNFGNNCVKNLSISCQSRLFYMRHIVDFKQLMNFRKNELEKYEFDKIHNFAINDFLNKNKYYFGLYDMDRLIALQWISIRGYKCVEWGLAVSKDYRKYNIANEIRERLEEYFFKNKISFFIRVFVHNKRGLEYFQKNGYQSYLLKDNVYYLKK